MFSAADRTAVARHENTTNSQGTLIISGRSELRFGTILSFSVGHGSVTDRQTDRTASFFNVRLLLLAADDDLDLTLAPPNPSAGMFLQTTTFGRPEDLDLTLALHGLLLF